MAYKHGLSSHPLYFKWNAMKQRCYNPCAVNYRYYGGRGIQVCAEWKDDPQAYFDYIMSLENAMHPGLTIDRIKNNEGYKPGNLAWKTNTEQVLNRRIQKSNTSGYTGITYNKTKRKWIAQIAITNTVKHIGVFNTIRQAVNGRNLYIYINGLKSKGYPYQFI